MIQGCSMFKWLITLLLLGFHLVAFSAPSEIIIIRHGDKLEQEHPGPTLDVIGEIRAINFAFYYINKFAVPDFIFASNPKKNSSSIREIQTIAPLVNMLQLKYPNSDIPIMHPYSSSDYESLAKYLLQDQSFNNKRVLIAWSHGKIPKLAKQLGIEDKLEKWSPEDYDSVYVLHYHHSGKFKDYQILHDQYPIKFNGTWQSLHTLVS